MLCLTLLLVLVTHPIRTAYVTNHPSFAAKLDRFYEKLERLTVTPHHETTTESKLDQWYHKLQKLNALTPDNFYLSDEDEDLLVAMQSWGRLSADQLDGVAKELQRIRDDREEDRSDYNELDDTDDDIDDYHNDGEFEEEEETELAPPRPLSPNVTPSAFTRAEEPVHHTVVSAVDPIAATNARPRILSDEPLTALQRSELRKGALANIGRVVRASKCLVPQPRWLKVRQLAPAADTVYMPPCVELHRCAPDSGCCSSEAEVCAPIEGAYVALPFYLHKADGTMSVARMLFFNHTQCACVSRDTLQTTIRSRPRDTRPPREEATPEHRAESRPELREERPETKEERRNPKEQRPETKEPREEDKEETSKEEPRDERQNDWNAATQQPQLDHDDEDVTAPSQMRRCTCPGQFLASMPASGPCSCVCDWPDGARRRDCLPLSRGEEHFGLRDRVCVESGDCSPPSCKYGAYDRKLGKCPARKYRRFRYHRRFHPEKTLVV